MHFPVPLNNLIGPGLAAGLLLGAVALAFVAVLYRAYLQRQYDAWAKPGRD